jgi:hypothetical protein
MEPLLGADIELLGLREHQLDSPAHWEQYLSRLSTLTNKGERTNLGDGFWVHRDGFAVEYGFDPATSVEEYIDKIVEGRDRAQNHIGCYLYEVDQFDVAPLLTRTSLPSVQQYLDIGCDRDYQARPDSVSLRPSPPRRFVTSTIRECGAHIHFSLPDVVRAEPMLTAEFIRQVNTVLFPYINWDGINRAATYYRRPGLFRHKPYGVEYRSLSVSALLSNEDAVASAFELLQAVWGGN